jgi:hypothetical protein
MSTARLYICHISDAGTAFSSRPLTLPSSRVLRDRFYADLSRERFTSCAVAAASQLQAFPRSGWPCCSHRTGWGNIALQPLQAWNGVSYLAPVLRSTLRR